jgi:hypothetical protein
MINRSVQPSPLKSLASTGIARMGNMGSCSTNWAGRLGKSSVPGNEGSGTSMSRVSPWSLPSGSMNSKVPSPFE